MDKKHYKAISSQASNQNNRIGRQFLHWAQRCMLREDGIDRSNLQVTPILTIGGSLSIITSLLSSKRASRKNWKNGKAKLIIKLEGNLSLKPIWRITKDILITKMLKKTRRNKQRWQKEKGLREIKRLRVKILAKLLHTIQIASILIPKCFSHMETEP